MSSALIYAELLSNIRQVSIIASLQTPSNQDTGATLSDDRQQLKLVHSGTTMSLMLPAQVAAIPGLRQPALGSREISWRLALPATASTNNGLDFADSTSAPWSASKLSEKSQVKCRKCGAVLLAVGSIQSWKDLPSENWAEMMDFWHCHKPHVHGKDFANGHNEGHLEEKGYGAKNRFMARNGVGFVDLTYFLFSEKDCAGIKVGIKISISSSFLAIPLVGIKKEALSAYALSG
jgi:ubiquitin-protein ligase E3 D